MLNQYELPIFLSLPEINPELLEFLLPGMVRRDDFLKQTQELTAYPIISAASSLIVLVDNEVEMEEKIWLQLINMVFESIQLQCQLFYEQPLSRKALILTAINDLKLKAVLETLKSDNFLFGFDLAAQIKTYKNVKSVANHISGGKTPRPHSISRAKSFLDQSSKYPFRNNLRWKGQGSQFNR